MGNDLGRLLSSAPSSLSSPPSVPLPPPVRQIQGGQNRMEKTQGIGKRGVIYIWSRPRGITTCVPNTARSKQGGSKRKRGVIYMVQG